MSNYLKKSPKIILLGFNDTMYFSISPHCLTSLKLGLLSYPSLETLWHRTWDKVPSKDLGMTC